MISAICWIPRGAATGVSFVADEEIDKSSSLDNRSGHVYHDNENMDNHDKNDMDTADGVQEDDAVKQAKDVANALSSQTDASFDCIATGLLKLNMESYDKEKNRINNILGVDSGELHHESNEMDPYFTKKNDGVDDEEAQEIEDMTVKSTDTLIISLHNDDEYNYLKVMIVEEFDGDGDYLNMYPCVEVPLRDFPLSVAWSDCCLKDGQKGNFMAIGTMGPEIEIWDLDTVNLMEPHTVLGGKLKDKKCKGKKMFRYHKDSHHDSVLSVAWNMEYKNVLASASADKTVKVWDVNVRKCVLTLEHHNSKVQAVAWNPHSPEIVLSGSFDKSVVLKDVKNSSSDCIKWSVDSDVETLTWDPHNQHLFVVTLENGMIQAFDKRRPSSSQCSSSALFTLHGHEKAVTTASFSSAVPNILATASFDKMVKLWDISNNQPSCITSLNPYVGPIFSVSFSKDSPFLLAVGGYKGDVTVWDTSADKNMEKYGVHTYAPVANKKIYRCM